MDDALWCICRVDAETNKRLELERSIRDLENRIDELNEDLDAEKASRSKAEKQKKEISEVCSFFVVNSKLFLLAVQ